MSIQPKLITRLNLDRVKRDRNYRCIDGHPYVDPPNRDLAELIATADLYLEAARRASECKHSDQACALVYWLNNTTGVDAPWRSWSCKTHGYGGSGATPECPRCNELERSDG